MISFQIFFLSFKDGRSVSIPEKQSIRGRALVTRSPTDFKTNLTDAPSTFLLPEAVDMCKSNEPPIASSLLAQCCPNFRNASVNIFGIK